RVAGPVQRQEVGGEVGQGRAVTGHGSTVPTPRKWSTRPRPAASTPAAASNRAPNRKSCRFEAQQPQVGVARSAGSAALHDAGMQVVAHRGASHEYAEHTIDAY